MIMLQQALITIQRGWGEWVLQVQQGIPGPRKNKYTSALKCLKPGSVNWNVHKPDRCCTRRHWDTLGDASLVHGDRDHGAGSSNWTLEGLRPLMGEDEGTRHSHQWELNDKHLLKNTKAKGKGAGPRTFPSSCCSCHTEAAVGLSCLLVQNANILGNSCEGPVKVPQHIDTFPPLTSQHVWQRDSSTLRAQVQTPAQVALPGYIPFVSPPLG